MDSFNIQNITPNLHSKNINQSKAELNDKKNPNQSDIHNNILNIEQSIKDKQINKTEKAHNKVWQLGMAESNIKSGHNIKKFLGSMKKLVGDNAEKILQPILNPVKKHNDSTNTTKKISLNKLKKNTIFNKIKSQISTYDDTGTIDNKDFLKLSDHEKALSEKLLKLGIEIRNNPTLDQINLELTKNNIKTQQTQANRAIQTSKDTVKIQKELMDKKIEKFSEQIRKQQEAAKKQMKNPIARFFLGIVKSVVSVIVGVITVNPMQIVMGVQQARIDFAMAKYSASKGNYAEIMKTINKIQQQIPTALTTIFSIVSAVTSAIASIYTGGVLSNVVKMIGNITDTSIEEGDKFATNKAKIEKDKALLEQERTQSNIGMRYDQLNKIINNINQYEALNKSKDISDTFSKSSELLKLSSDQKSQFFSSRI